MNYETILSNKGKPLVKFNNYIYRLRSKTPTTNYYSCVLKSCYSRGKLENDVFFTTSEHNHEQDCVDLIQRNQRNEIKKVLKTNTTLSGYQVYQTATSAIIDGTDADSCQIGVSIQPFSSLQPTISYNKRKSLPTLPQTRASIKIPEKFKALKNSEIFLLADDGDDDKILIFGTIKFLDYLCQSNCVYMDGTFKCVPTLFYQLYTLHCKIGEIMIPILYVLLPDKRKDTYIRMFRLIQDIAYQNNFIFSPNCFMIDFERGVISAIEVLFASATIKCCSYHFSQCIWRKVQALGLSTNYSTNEVFAKTVKRMMALNMAKPDDLSSLFETIICDADGCEQIDDIFSYFYDNFFKSDARFPNKLWNFYGFIGPRTNNHVEGWHNAMNFDVKHPHPNLWVFINKIMYQHQVHETKLMIQNSGTNVCKKRCKRLKIIAQIESLTEKYDRNDISAIDYIDRVKYLKIN